MRAVVALRRRVFVRVHVKRVVRTCLRACLTADAATRVEIDDAILACEERRHGTDLDTRRVGAMIAPHDREQSARVGKGSCLDVLPPRPVHTDRHFVLSFARDGTRVAPDTFSVVDDEAEVHIQGIGRFDARLNSLGLRVTRRYPIPRQRERARIG